jgi:hypothetical protein
MRNNTKTLFRASASYSKLSIKKPISIPMKIQKVNIYQEHHFREWQFLENCRAPEFNTRGNPIKQLIFERNLKIYKPVETIGN